MELSRQNRFINTWHVSLKFISNDTSSNNSDQFNMNNFWMKFEDRHNKKIYSLDEIDPIFI